MMDDTAFVSTDAQEESASPAVSDDGDAAASSEPAAPAEETAAVQEVVISSQQFDLLLGGFKACATVSLCSLVLTAFLLGSVLYAHLVRGWRA